SDKMLKRCEEIMREACTDFEAELKQFNGEEDQLHLHYPPKVQLSKLVNSPKGTSSRRLRQDYDTHIRRHLRDGQFWSGSHFTGSCHGAPLTVARQYIDNQKRPVGRGEQCRPVLTRESEQSRDGLHPRRKRRNTGQDQKVDVVPVGINDVGGPQGERQERAPPLAVADPYFKLTLVIAVLQNESGKRGLELDEELLRFSTAHGESGRQLGLLVRPGSQTGR
ncbi:IS200/IS605 family transposase, partial [Streptomyces sp. NPDC058293]|uniref:IS200/IS605 family transposase n=1 Tax=Streptomyces sp. NPDC058293 TaxID=3346429 RepID=UPI0036E50A44